MPMMWYSTGNGPAWVIGMLAVWVFWFALIGGGIWALLRWVRPQASHPMTALETLHMRYARGEIDTATFEHMRERLQGTPTPGPRV